MAKTYKAKKSQKYQAIGYRPSRNLVVALAILISVGLVGSVLVSAIFGMSNLVNPSQIDSYKETLKKNPNDVNTRIALGHALFDQANALSQKKNKQDDATKLYGEAEAQYKKVLQKQPKNSEVAGNLAIVYFYTNRTDLAVQTAEKALKDNPNFYPTRLNYGAFFLGYGKQNYIGAIKELEKIPKSAPEYARAQEFINQYKAELKKKPPVSLPNAPQQQPNIKK